MNLHENISRVKELMGLIFEEPTKQYGTIIVLGPQGVGKSTITNLLGKKLQMPVISSDDYVEQGDWKTEKNKKQGWLKRKENEFGGTVEYLKSNLGKPVILGFTLGVLQLSNVSRGKTILRRGVNESRLGLSKLIF